MATTKKENTETPEAKYNYFEILNKVDCSGKVEKKNGLSYLSWAFAWGELKRRFPHSYYTIYENENGYNYFTDGRTCWVKTGVTVVYGLGAFKIEHIEYLPVMDFRNNSIPLEKVTSFDVNKTIQRSLTKAVARHGLGLYIYAGEDLPEVEKCEAAKPETAPTPTPEPAKPETAKKPNKVRGDFVEYCKENDIKGEEFNVICKMFKLNNTAPDDNFVEALDYCQDIVKKRLYAQNLAEELGDYPEEV